MFAAILIVYDAKIKTTLVLVAYVNYMSIVTDEYDILQCATCKQLVTFQFNTGGMPHAHS